MTRYMALRLIPITESFVCMGRAIVDCGGNDEMKWVREREWGSRGGGGGGVLGPSPLENLARH